MSIETGKFVLENDVTIQTRLARGVSEPLQQSIVEVCRKNSTAQACYLIDVKRPESEEVRLMIALTLDTEAEQLEMVATEFQSMLMNFPSERSKVYIASSARLLPRFAGCEFYKKV